VRQGATAELSREIADAGRSLVRLARFDPLWHEGLDITGGGFVRSFFAPLFALPFHLVFAALVTTGGGSEPITVRALVALALAHLLNTFGYPILVALFARPLGFSAGFAPFIILVNWTCLFFNMALCAIAPLTLLGQGGFDIMGLIWMVLFGLRVFVTWRSARNTLSADFAPALLMIGCWW
jgi:hypothetical protein